MKWFAKHWEWVAIAVGLGLAAFTVYRLWPRRKTKEIRFDVGFTVAGDARDDVILVDESIMGDNPGN